LTEPMRISVREERHSQSVVRKVVIDAARGPLELFYEISGDILPPPLEVHDFAVVAALFAAMREGRPIHIDGPVTATLLRNLEEFQEAWALWRSSFRRVSITADQILPVQQPASRRGVFAVSGGVDGTFALLRHHGGHAGLRTARPVCATVVHGFDIPLPEQRAFEHAHRSISDVTNALGVPLAIVRTNWRELFSKEWNMEYHIALAACLFQFRGLANVGVSGACEDYGHLVLPWGSNPVTNNLLAGGGFDLHTEGGGFTRTQRVRLICDYPDVAAKLRVCWEGPITGGNCGHCEKCIRTKLNFMANGFEPLCFDDRPTQLEILRLTTRNAAQLALLKELVASAKKNGVTDRWTTSLKLAIAKNRLALPTRSLQARVYRKLRSLSRRIAQVSTGPTIGAPVGQPSERGKPGMRPN
jgi:hypothetical protein